MSAHGAFGLRCRPDLMEVCFIADVLGIWYLLALIRVFDLAYVSGTPIASITTTTA